MLTHRLALGVQIVDALRAEPADVEVALEEVPRPYEVPAPTSLEAAAAMLYNPGIGLPRLHRGRRPGRFRLMFGDRTAPPVRMRVYDTARRYVPRRLEVPFAPLADVLAEEAPGVRPASRARRIDVFPGTAYGPQANATGIRGRVVDSAGVPVPWVRVTARHPAAQPLEQDGVLGRAHGDDRGEFLLVLGVPPTYANPSAFTFEVLLDLAARPAPPLGGPVGTREDPLADLLLETLPRVGIADDVSGGATVPAAHSVHFTVTVPLQLGRLVSPQSPFTLP
ncbi:hypothetical protein [Streptomyces sp. NPDC005141]